MALEIFPQQITLYPGDKQSFSVRAIPSPVLWVAMTNATLQSDGTLNLNTGSSASMLVAQSATGGVAGAEFVFDNRMLPTSTGNILFVLTGAASHALRVTVNPTTTVVKDENNNTVASISRNVVAADVYYLEVAGNLLRLFINGQISAEYVAAGATRYPVRLRVDGNPPYANGSPHVVVPKLLGNWDIDPTSSASSSWTPDGGTLSASSDVWATTFTAGSDPGVYDLTAQLGGTSLQKALAKIIIPPLSILGETAVTLAPGEVVYFQTNYDAAQTRIVTWSVVSGSGSFTNGRFTAGTAPGATIVKAVSGNQEARITITVPATMTITTSDNVSTTAAKLGEVLTLTTNMTGTVNWTASVGTLSASSGATVTWTAPNQAGIKALITATNGTYTVTAEISVLKHLAYEPSSVVTFEKRRTVLVSRAEDRSRYARIKDGAGLPFEAFELQFRNRDKTELAAVFALWQEHYPGSEILFIDSPRKLRRVCFFDSDIKAEVSADCSIDYSLRLTE